MEIAACKDLLQEDKPLTIPEIRVWFHPHKVGGDGDDYYKVYDSFCDAIIAVDTSDEAEGPPLVAIGGYELDLWSTTKSHGSHDAGLEEAAKIAKTIQGKD